MRLGGDFFNDFLRDFLFGLLLNDFLLGDLFCDGRDDGLALLLGHLHLKGLLFDEAFLNQGLGGLVGQIIVHLGHVALLQAELGGGRGNQIKRVFGATVVGDAVEAGHLGVLLGGGRLDLVLGVGIVGGVKGEVEIQRLAAHVELGQLVAPRVETVVLPTHSAGDLLVAKQRVLERGVVIFGSVGRLHELGGEGLDEPHVDFFARGLVHTHQLQHFVLVFALGFFLFLAFFFGFFGLRGFFLFGFRLDVLFDGDRLFNGGLYDGLLLDKFLLRLLGNLLFLFGGHFDEGFLAHYAFDGLAVLHHDNVDFLAMAHNLFGGFVLALLAFDLLLVQDGDQNDDGADDCEGDAQADGKVFGQELLRGDV